MNTKQGHHGCHTIWTYFTMKRYLFSILLVSTGCTSIYNNTSAPQSCSRSIAADKIFGDSRESIALVRTNAGLGTAFVFSQNKNQTLLATNAHITSGYRLASIEWINGRVHTAEVIKEGEAESSSNDLAVLLIRDKVGSVLPIMTSNPSVGSDLYALGNPRGLSFSMTKGILSGIRESGRIIQIDMPINPGNSGGPVLNSAGCVVGVVTSKQGESEGLAFAISAQRLIDFNTSGIINPQSQQAEKSSKKATKPPTSQVSICSFNAKKEECEIGFDGDSTVIVIFSSDGKVVRYHFGKDEVQIIEDNGRISTGTYSRVGDQVIIYSSNGNTTVIPLTQS